MATQDATVTAKDLLKAGSEISDTTPEAAAAWLREIEPVLVRYIEASADQIAGRLAVAAPTIDDIRRVAMEVRKVAFVLMRAHEIGYYRLWANAFLEQEPLSQLKEPSPKKGPKGGGK